MLECDVLVEQEDGTHYTCTLCHTPFTWKQLIIHFQTRHSNDQRLTQCHPCRRIFNNDINRALVHYCNAQNMVKMCRICNERFQLYQVFKQHARRKNCIKEHMKIHESKPYLCELCNLDFDRIMKLKNHLRIAHNGNKLCDVCFRSEGLATRECLLEHLSRHEKLLSRTCGLCIKRFNGAVHLDEHLVKEHPFVYEACPACGEAHKIGTALDHHVRLMHNDRKKQYFECRYCCWTFSTSSHLIMHREVCEGIPYSLETLKTWKDSFREVDDIYDQQ